MERSLTNAISIIILKQKGKINYETREAEVRETSVKIELPCNCLIMDMLLFHSVLLT